MRTNVVLDIDGVLACNRVGCLEHASFFNNKGLIIQAIKTHYIFPGVIELIQLLFQTEHVSVSFFSAGANERNIVFVENLLMHALGEVKYGEIKGKVRVLSRQDLTETEDAEQERQHFLYQIAPGRNQKDISKVLSEGDFLEDAVLVDDDSMYIASGQVKNFLHVKESQNGNFENLCFKQEDYHRAGYRIQKCILTSDTSKNPWKQIVILKRGDGFDIEFRSKETNTCRFESVSLEKHGELFVQLNALYQENIEKGRTTCEIQDEKLLETISEVIAASGGQMKKICRQVNRIYYVAGLFFKALEESRSEGIPISEVLFRKQFKLERECRVDQLRLTDPLEDDRPGSPDDIVVIDDLESQPARYEPDFKRLRKDCDLYRFGLEKLRAVNRDLEFTTPHSYVECINLPRSKEELLILQEAIENQGNGCCIM